MKKQWILSGIATIIIWGAGAYTFTFIKDYVPSQLHTPSTLLASEPLEINEDTIPIDKAKDLKEIIHETQKLVVQVELDNGSLGSGFLYNDQGDVVTNAHVVAGATDVQVTMSDNREFAGKVIGISESTDVAVVRVDGLKGTPPLKVSRETISEVGDEVLALGSPLGFQNTVTTGIISGVNRDFELPPFYYEDMYQISAPIAPGNSGGPLIDRKTGEVIGINSASAEQGSIGFSIPLPNVIALIEGWSEKPMTTLPTIESIDDYAFSEEAYLDEDMAQFLVSYFYESLNIQDYVIAYSLLGSSWQGNLPYESFRKGYLNTKSVVIDDLIVQTNEDIIVTAIITAKERNDGSDTVNKYKVTYTVGYENDEMKILSGTGEVLN
jgi:hypothetical protein